MSNQSNFALGFNPTQLGPDGGGGQVVWPDGTHDVVVDKIEQKGTTKGGGMAVVFYKAISGPMSGTSITENFNLWHQTEAVKIRAAKDMSRLLWAMGRGNLGREAAANDFIGAPFKLTVGHETVESPSRDDPSKLVKFTNNTILKVLNAAGVEPADAARGETAPKAAGWAAGPAAEQPQQPQVEQKPAETAPAWGAQPAETAPATAGWQPQTAAPAATGTAPWGAS